MASNYYVKETILTESGANGSMVFDKDTCGFSLDMVHAEHELWCDPVNGAGTAEATVQLFNPLSGVFVDVTTSWKAGDMPISISSLGVIDETGSTQSGPVRPLKIKVVWANTNGTSRVMLRSRMASD